MTTRRMLELAALATGLKHLEWVDTKPGRGMMVHVHRDESGRREERWNPLADDGDAFRLMVKLGIEFYEGDDDGKAAYAGWFPPFGNTRRQKFCVERHADHQDPCAATRLAVVLAAAALGEEMEKGKK